MVNITAKLLSPMSLLRTSFGTMFLLDTSSLSQSHREVTAHQVHLAIASSRFHLSKSAQFLSPTCRKGNLEDMSQIH